MWSCDELAACPDWRLWERLQQTPRHRECGRKWVWKRDGWMENIYCSAVPARLKVSL